MADYVALEFLLIRLSGYIYDASTKMSQRTKERPDEVSREVGNNICIKFIMNCIFSGIVFIVVAWAVCVLKELRSSS